MRFFSDDLRLVSRCQMDGATLAQCAGHMALAGTAPFRTVSNLALNTLEGSDSNVFGSHQRGLRHIFA